MGPRLSVKLCDEEPRLLPVPLRAIVRFAKHFTIRGGSRTTFAPGGNVIGFHLFDGPNFRFVRIMAHCAQGAVGFPFGVRSLGLCRVNGPFRRLVKDPDIQ